MKRLTEMYFIEWRLHSDGDKNDWAERYSPGSDAVAREPPHPFGGTRVATGTPTHNVALGSPGHR